MGKVSDSAICQQNVLGEKRWNPTQKSDYSVNPSSRTPCANLGFSGCLCLPLQECDHPQGPFFNWRFTKERGKYILNSFYRIIYHHLVYLYSAAITQLNLKPQGLSGFV